MEGLQFKKYVPRATARITTDGYIVLSELASRKYGIVPSKSVELYWDEKRRAVGIEVNDSGTFPVIGLKRARIISCAGDVDIQCWEFLDANGIRGSFEIYPLHRDDDTGFMYFILG
jgi:hypothetical protein